MTRPIYIKAALKTVLAAVVGSVLGCAESDHEMKAASPLVLRGSVTLEKAGVGYVHVFALNSSEEELGWIVEDAKLLERPNSACDQLGDMPEESSSATSEEAQFPELSFGLASFLMPGEWHVRTLSFPASLFGKGCSVDLTVSDSSQSSGRRRHHLSLELRDGVFESLPSQVLSATTDLDIKAAKPEYLGEYQVYVVRVLVQAGRKGVFRFMWPSTASCGGQSRAIPLRRILRKSLPNLEAQRVTVGQWATAAMAFESGVVRQTLVDCVAKIDVVFFSDTGVIEMRRNLSIDLSQALSMPAGDMAW